MNFITESDKKDLTFYRGPRDDFKNKLLYYEWLGWRELYINCENSRLKYLYKEKMNKLNIYMSVN